MAENAGGSDLSVGLPYVLGAVAVLAALVTTVTSYLDAVNGTDYQLVAGLGIAVAMIAGGLAVVAIHAFD